MKLKNVLFSSLFVVMIMAGTTANAQLKFGIRGEVGINKPTLDKTLYSVENMNAFKIGPTLEFMLPIMDLGLDASLLYSNEKMKVKDFKLDKVLDEVASHYLDVPANLKYKIGIVSPVKVFLAAGPYIQFKVGGDDFKYEAIKKQAEDKKFQAGINLGLGAEIINKIQVGFGYRIKLTDDYSANEPELKDVLNNKSGIWSLTAAVYF